MLLALVKSYLVGRLMKVKVGGSLSTSARVKLGVVQGSALGPLLFAAYINSVANLVLEGGGQIILFADDMHLIQPMDGELSETHLPSNVTLIKGSLDALGLLQNKYKSKYIMFSLDPRGPPKKRSLLMGEEELEQVTVFRYLGSEVDERLSFTHQSRSATVKAKH
jgi:hypothetical protein